MASTPQAGPPNIAPLVEPASGKLPFGVTVNGVRVREFRLGVLTEDGDLRAMLAYPPSVDPELVYRFWSEAQARAKKQKIEGPALTQAERERAAMMIEVMRRVELRYRVEYLGGLPPDQIPEVVATLAKEDIVTLIGAAKEVDERLEKFRVADKTDVAAPGNTFGGEPADPDGPSGPPDSNA